jgi:hypothetical protein
VSTLPKNHRLAERALLTLVGSELQIDPQGRIWRIAARRGRKGGGSHVIPVKRRRAEKLLPLGYLMVRGTVDDKRVCGLAHRLVWQFTHGDIPVGSVINHKNGLKDDNRPENLQAVTPSENAQHAHASGLFDQSGERNNAARLRDRAVAQIRLAYHHGGFTMQQLADRFGVSVQHISKIVRGLRRAKQGGPQIHSDQRHCGANRDPLTGRFIASAEVRA